jgi:hypothetical protein
MVVRTLKRDENKLRCSVNLPGVTTLSGLGVARELLATWDENSMPSWDVNSPPTRGTSTGTGHYYE